MYEAYKPLHMRLYEEVYCKNFLMMCYQTLTLNDLGVIRYYLFLTLDDDLPSLECV